MTIECTPSAEGARTATLKVNHNAAESPATYTLNCTGKLPSNLVCKPKETETPLSLITLVYPKGGEYLQHTDTVDVKWTYLFTVTKTVTLEILKDNTVLVTKTGLNRDTAFSLVINRDIPNVKGSSTYQIRIIGIAADGGEAARDTSSFFSIYNSDELTTPIPSISPPSGTYILGQSVIIRKAGVMMGIRYTTDGTTPTESNGYDYSVPFTISEPVTIKAIAMFGIGKSAAVEAVYDKTKLREPEIAYTDTDAILTTIAGASIRYTLDGTDPAPSTGTEYSAPFIVPKTATVKAIAYKDGLTTSDVGIYDCTVATAPGYSSAPAPGSTVDVGSRRCEVLLSARH